VQELTATRANTPDISEAVDKEERRNDVEFKTKVAFIGLGLSWARVVPAEGEN